MAGKREKKGVKGGVIVKKYEIVEGGHHGGAWKVAYADFVTAMMAFFLLMWLLNATTEDQRKGLADYFSPNNLMSHASSGTGDPFGGHTAFDEGALVSDRGAVEITAGKRPAVEKTEDGDDPSIPTSTTPEPATASAPGAGRDDQDADTGEKPLGQRARAPRPVRAAGPTSSAKASPTPGRSPPADVVSGKGARGKGGVRTGGPADQRRRAERSRVGGSRQATRDRHDPGRVAHPDPRRGQTADVPVRIRHAERTGQAADAEDRARADEAEPADFDRRTYRRRTVSRPRPDQLGVVGRTGQRDHGGC